MEEFVYLYGIRSTTIVGIDLVVKKGGGVP